jgi:hypothetical protein
VRINLQGGEKNRYASSITVPPGPPTRDGQQLLGSKVC